MNRTPTIERRFGDAIQELDSLQGLVQAAATASLLFTPQERPSHLWGQLQGLGIRVRKSLNYPSPQAILAHIHSSWFRGPAYQGEHRFDLFPLADMLPAVWRLRQGSSATMALLYRVIVEASGLRADGIRGGNYFLVRVQQTPQESVLIDPYMGGRLVSADEAVARLNLVAGEDRFDHSDLTRACTHQEWLDTILANLQVNWAMLGAELDAADVADMRRRLRNPGMERRAL